MTGDTVNYRAADADKDVLDGFEKVEGLIYNLDGEIVYKNTISAKKFKKDGFDFDTSGFSGNFAAEIYGVRADGTKSAFEYFPLGRLPA